MQGVSFNSLPDGNCKVDIRFGSQDQFAVGEKIICPVHWDTRYHSATVVEWEVWANEKQKQRYVRVLTDEGRKESVLRREVVKSTE